MVHSIMLALINTNTIAPPIGPVGLDYVATAARAAGFEVELLDLCLADDPAGAIRRFFASRSPQLVGLTFRNVDDCFWPSCQSFVPGLLQIVQEVRNFTDAPIVLGGVGYSLFPKRLLELTGVEFGVRGDGERAIVQLLGQLRGQRRFEKVAGLVWRRDGDIVANAPAWDAPLRLETSRDMIDNVAYFKRGGQGGVETKRGCDRACTYCADPLAKGRVVRLRHPAEVADEVETLLGRGIDVLHLCDGEFNIPPDHALAVCDEFIRRGLGRRVRWYTYMAVVPFDAQLAEAMRRAGCVGIDFTGDSADPRMLATYRHLHRRDDISRAVKLCRDNGIRVMVDLLLGGPGETPRSAGRTIEFMKQIDPDCVGAALGVRVYPGTVMEKIIAGEGPLESNRSIRRRYDGPVDLLRPTFYVSAELGDQPGRVVRDLIGGDKRFFEPSPQFDDEGNSDEAANYNYNDNTPLLEAIAAGARGAYWDILRSLRGN